MRAFATAALLIVTACSPDSVLDVTDPDVINPDDVNSPAAVEGLRLGTLRSLNEATSGDESLFLFGGLLADEWRSGDTFVQRDETDKRTVQISNSLVDLAWRDVHQARVSAQLTLAGYVKFPPEAADAWKVGQMLAVQGYTETLLGEHFCNGIPFSTIENGAEVYGDPITVAATFQRAIGHFDEALAAVQGATGADAVAVGQLAAIGKARALLNLSDPSAAATDLSDEAAAAVAGVPTAFAFVMLHSSTTEENTIWSLNNSARRYTVAPGEGGNGIPFTTAADPRVPVGPRVARGAFDTVTDLHRQLIWPDRESPVGIVTGIEARLIEAEAAYQAGNYATPVTGTLAILNDLRANFAPAGSTLPPLPAATTAPEQEDQIFDERAFWLFSTGHRLGDLRRLIRQYGRTEDAVFPTGAFFKGGEYGDDVNLPIPQDEENNPNFEQCLNRNA